MIWSFSAQRLVRSVEVMFVILIDYTASLDRIDAALPDHNAWLDEQYAARVFVASGPKTPRTGGVILTGDHPAEVIRAIVARDPFATAGLASHTVVEFQPIRRAPLSDL
ncbi:YciI family protein [Rudaeicoccus suwonensis]|nr:YciI family protein [Rudaeicoccus suwonensis]